LRFVVYGVGAIGGVLGASLHASGQEVALIARGKQFEAISAQGLRFERPTGSDLLSIPIARHPGELQLGPHDVVLLTMKSQHTASSLQELAECGHPEIPVLSVQNGVDNERQALRLFSRVYGVTVNLPAAYLEPGTVQAYSSPTLGILDIGRYPSGSDELAKAVSSAFRVAGIASEVRADIMRWKYRKLLFNLTNAIEAACGPGTREGPLAEMVAAEGEACLRAAGVEFVSDREESERRGELIQMRSVAGKMRPGASAWQSLRRKAGTTEVDYLNGEIVLLGRRYSVATPANELLQSLVREMARNLQPPGSITMEQMLALVTSRSTR
jgi:2-dehydropantoate 2-reductase